MVYARKKGVRLWQGRKAQRYGQKILAPQYKRCEALQIVVSYVVPGATYSLGRSNRAYTKQAESRIIRLAGGQGWFPPRAVIESSFTSDWLTFPMIAINGYYNTSVKLNSIYRPMFSLPGAPGFSFQGLSTVMSSTGGEVNSVYQYARILYAKISVEIARATAPVNSFTCALFPDVDGNLGTTLPYQVENQPNSVVKVINNDATNPVVLNNQISPRKMLGLTKAQYSDLAYVGTDVADPAVLRSWVLSFQPVNKAAEAAGTYAFRVKITSLIELSTPWDSPILVPVLGAPAIQPEEKKVDRVDEEDEYEMESGPPSLAKLKVSSPTSHGDAGRRARPPLVRMGASNSLR